MICMLDKSKACKSTCFVAYILDVSVLAANNKLQRKALYLCLCLKSGRIISQCFA